MDSAATQGPTSGRRPLAERRLLTDPFLQLATADSVRVVWMTEFVGSCHLVLVGVWVRDLDLASALALANDHADRDGAIVAHSRLLDQLAEDADSALLSGWPYTEPSPRPIWRHEAHVQNLRPGERTWYRVLSAEPSGTARAGVRIALSEAFTLAPAARPGEGQRILITSDHQHKPMTPANLAKAAEVAGVAGADDETGRAGISAVFCPGDMVNVPDRASDWFDDADGRSFFAVLQGRGDTTLAGRTWHGAPILQHVPLYPAVGNHEVMGRPLPSGSLWERFEGAWPPHAAEARYAELATTVNPTGDPEVARRWIDDHTYNTHTYEQIFTLPGGSPSPRYYATTVGNIRLIVLCATAIWRTPTRGGTEPSKYDEPPQRLADPDRWGHGQHIVEPIGPGSPQYRWLAGELASEACRRARYRVVMYHQPAHGVGWSVVPAFTDPVSVVDRDPDTDAVTLVRYEYPRERDYLLTDIEPLLSAHGVHLVINGHTHFWNRFRSAAGVHFLESSNIGNTHGAYVPGHLSRDVPTSREGFVESYAAQGDPGGLEPIVPTVAPRYGPDGEPEPFLASDTVTAFSILDTVDGVVRSYRFDTERPDSAVVLFDEFPLD